MSRQRFSRPIVRGVAVIALIVPLAAVGQIGDSRPGSQETITTFAQSLDDDGPELAVQSLDGPVRSRLQVVQSIKQKQKAVIEETCAALDLVIVPEDLDGAVSRQQAQCAVAKRAADAVTDDDINAVAIKRGATTSVYAEYTGRNRDEQPEGVSEPGWEPGDPSLEGVEYLGKKYVSDGDGDGICNPKGNQDLVVQGSSATGHGKKLTGYSEWCAEIIGDGVGDDDGFCEKQDPKGKPKAFEERCVTLEPTFADIYADDQNIDLGRLEDYDALLGQAEETAVEFRAATARAVALMATPPQVATTLKACKKNQDRLNDNGIALGVVTGLAATLEGIANTMSPFFGQTVVVAGFGGNAESAGSILYAVAAAADVTAIALEVTTDVDTATNVTNTLECLSEFRAESDQAITGLTEDVASLTQITLRTVELKEKASYLITATLTGQPLDDVMLTSVKVSSRSPVQFQALDSVNYGWAKVDGLDGTYELAISLPSRLRNAEFFVFDVEYQSVDGPVYGHVLFDR